MKTTVNTHALAIETVMVNGAVGAVELQVYETAHGAYLALDGSWIESCAEDEGPLFIADPYNEGMSLRLIESKREIKEKRATLVSGSVDQVLVDEVIDQIVKDINDGDQTALSELLSFIPSHNLKSYITE